MRKPNIAILGATGVVGREITKIIDELKIDFNEIKFLSSAKSAGTKLEFQGKTYVVEEAKPESFDGVNIVLASAGGSTSQKFAPEIVKRGGVLIDNSSAFRCHFFFRYRPAYRRNIRCNTFCKTMPLVFPHKMHAFG